jgi:hypothetical protein
MLYNDRNFKSSAHISDTPHETLILAEMILNNSSLQLIDNGKQNRSLAKSDLKKNSSCH